MRPIHTRNELVCFTTNFWRNSCGSKWFHSSSTRASCECAPAQPGLPVLDTSTDANGALPGLCFAPRASRGSPGLRFGSKSAAIVASLGEVVSRPWKASQFLACGHHSVPAWAHFLLCPLPAAAAATPVLSASSVHQNGGCCPYLLQNLELTSALGSCCSLSAPNSLAVVLMSLPGPSLSQPGTAL